MDELTQNNFINELKSEFPEFTFKTGSRFSFRPPKTIFLGSPQPNFALLTLHELGHALSKHYIASTHVERLKIESEAWQLAKTLIQNHPNWSKTYGLAYDEDFAEDNLDSYRNWLHTKSKCKSCGLTMCQDAKTGQYSCPRCDLL